MPRGFAVKHVAKGLFKNLTLADAERIQQTDTTSSAQKTVV